MTVLSVYKNFDIEHVCRSLDAQEQADSYILGLPGTEGDSVPTRGYVLFRIYQALLEVNRTNGFPYRVRNRQGKGVTVSPQKLAALFTPPPCQGLLEQDLGGYQGIHAWTYYQAVKESGIEIGAFSGVGDGGEGAKNAELVNSFTQNMRSVLKSGGFKRQLAVVERDCRDSYMTTQALLRSAYDRCDATTILRIELYPSPPEADDSPERVEFLVQELMSLLRQHSFYRLMAGYIYGIQFSQSGGLTAHLMLLLEETPVTSEIASIINEEWVISINAGRGRTGVCSGHPNIYKNLSNTVIYKGNSSLYYEVLASLAQWAKVGLFIPVSQKLKVVRLR